MARITVYVPDELLERARELDKEAQNVSQVVRRGLERLVYEHTAVPTYATPPSNTSERVKSLQDKLASEARQEYEIGYAAALDTAEELSLSLLNELAESDFDVAKWLKPYRQAAADELYEKGEAVWVGTSDDSSDEWLYGLLRDREGGRPPAPAETSWGWVWKLAWTLGTVADRIGFDESSFSPTKARVRGFADAMRELWSAIETSDRHLSSADYPNTSDVHESKDGGDGTSGI